MAGLAMGSAYLGAWGEGRPQPLALYARIELFVAATGAFSLVGLTLVRSLYVAAYPVAGGSQPLLLTLRFVGAALVLFLPTFLMGGTLPILIAAVTRNSTELSGRISQLYWVNTLGAVAGTLICGFFLLPTLGLRLTIACAVMLNIIAGVVALRIAQPGQAQGYAIPRTEAAPSKASFIGRDPQPDTFRFLLFLFAVVGCTAFAYEIAWTRLLSISIGSSTYAFTLMLATFLVGAVIGSAIYQHFFADSSRVSIATLSWTQLGIGIGTLASLVLFHWIPAVVPPLLRATDQSFTGVVLAQSVACVLSLLPVALIFGFNFPLVVVLLDRSAEASAGRAKTVGQAYAANTIGAIVGSMACGFWLVPRVGSFRIIVAAAAANLLLALAVDLRQKRRMLLLVLDGACLLLAVGIAFSPFFYNRSLLSLSAVLYGNAYEGKLSLGEIARTMDLVYSSEGVNASITVVRTENNVALRINGKVDASTDDASTQLLLGHLGAAFHPSPRKVLIIGFGGGMTASAVSRYPDVEKIDCVEIEPAVIRAAPYLQSLGRDVLKDPRLHIIYDDARNFLLTTREKYDLIISEPSNPWIAGIATLFTDEYYAAARQRLAPGGMLVQWVQEYSTAPDDVRMIVHTLEPHFPEVTLWRAGETDLLLLGRTDPTPFNFRRLASFWSNDALRADFDSLSVHQPEGLGAYFLLDDSVVRKLAEGAPVNTDDRTLLEYHAPRSLLAPADADKEMIAEYREGPIPANLDSSAKAVALQAGVITALDINDNSNAKLFLRALESQPDNVARYLARGRLALLQNTLPAAVSSFDEALRLQPDSLEAMNWLAVAEHRSGEETSAQSRVDQILKRNPHYLPALEDQVQFAADRKDFNAAVHAQMAHIAALPDPPASAYCTLGELWDSASNSAEAESASLKGLEKDPYSYACHVELASLYQRTGRLPQARDNYEWALRFFPTDDATIFHALAEVYVALGDRHSAESVLRRGRRLFPGHPELQNIAD
jgi:spermidine synthase